MSHINFKKKIAKLNKFMKLSDREVYYRMFHSTVLKASYNYMEVEDDLKRLVYQHFEGAKCEIFYLGSRVIGLGYDQESDLDLFIDIGNRYYLDREYDADVKQIEYLKDIFENKMTSEWIYKKINYSVPSIKAVHRKSEILCDISVTNGLAVHNSHLLGHLFDLQPEAVAIFHYIKKWLALFDVRFKGFTLTLLLIFYLQNRQLLPTIKRVQKGVSPKIVIDGYNVQFDESRDREFYGIEKIEYYKDHIQDFFDFYAEFNFENKIICTYTARAYDKDCYFESIDTNAALTVAAPLLRRTNCSKYITNFQLTEFIEACRFSCGYLNEYTPPKNNNDFEFYYDTKHTHEYRHQTYDVLI